MKHLKQEFDKLTFKETLSYTIACLSLIAGFVLLFLGMYLPPIGEIHPSVLSAFGVINVFSGALLGYSLKVDADNKKFKAEIINLITSLNKPESNETN